MKKKLLIFTVLSFVIVSTIFLLDAGSKMSDKNKQVKKRQELSANSKKPMRVKKAISFHKRVKKPKIKKIVPEEKNPLMAAADLKHEEPKKDKIFNEEDEKFDNPNKFVEFETRIRRAPGKITSNYPSNYKMTELNKAVERRFNVNFSKYNSSFKQLQSAALPWIERGPGNVTGRTRGLIIDPDDPSGNTWFAGSVGGGIWKTTDGGTDWTNKTPGLPDLATSTLAMAPSNHNIIYAGTGEGFFNADAIAGDGIFKSTDHGETWNQLVSTTNNVDFHCINRIIVNPTDANMVYVCANVDYNASNLGTYSNIFKSTDGGITWNSIYNNPTSRIQQLLFNPQNFNTIFATINGIGVIKSPDGGKTWDSTNGIASVGRIEIAIAPTDTTRMYASAEEASGSGLYISNDAGSNWVPVEESSGNGPDWLGGQGWYDNTLVVHPYSKDTLFVGGVNVYKIGMVSGIDTINQITSSVSSSENFLSFINWGGSLFYGGGGTGNTFLGDTEVAASDYVSVEIRFGPGISQKAHRFVRDASGTYKYQDYISVPFQVWDVTNNKQIMASFRDWLGNGMFTLVNYDPSNIGREYLFINEIPYDSLNPSSSIAVDNGMKYKNIYAIWPILSDSATWDPNNLPASSLDIIYQTIYAKTRNSKQLTNWYAGAGYPYTHADHHNLNIIPVNQGANSFRIIDPNDGGMSVSNTSGTTWSQITSYQTTQFYGADKNPSADQYLGGMQDNGTWYSGTNPNSGSAYLNLLGGDGFAVDWKYDDANQLLGSVYNNEIFKSTDGGKTMNPANNGFSDWGSSNSPFITSIAKSNEDPDLVFAASSSGIWRSDNFANSWNLIPLPFTGADYGLFAPVNISLANPQIVWTAANNLTGFQLAVSTDGGLSFSSPLSDSTVYPGTISGFATHPTQDSTAFVLSSLAQSPKILRTTDLGKTWTDISGFGSGNTSLNGFPDVAVYSLLVMPNHPDTIWVGTEIGLFESTNNGKSWAMAGNGLPAVSIWDMKVIGDQIVVATHGRGIWSINPSWLAGYTIPVVTKSPRINSLAEDINDALNISFSLRSSYDSSLVIVNGKTTAKFSSNFTAIDTSIKLPVNSPGLDSVWIISYKSGWQYKSSKLYELAEVLEAERSSYSNDFSSPTNDFAGEGFTISKIAGFSSPAIQSPHPYQDNTDDFYELLVPLKVASSNATLSYDDVALVEPADVGAAFGSLNFNDFVVVEGSADGLMWNSLAPGYNSRSDSVWLNAFLAGKPGDSTMFRHHSLNILNTFNAGQKILIRFRLHADANTHGFGWTIDNLSIQPTATKINEQISNLPKEFNLSQNYPNPFNPSTIINFQIPVNEKVTLTIYNSLGERIKTLINDFRNAGYYNVVWDGKNENNVQTASGVYLYRIQAGNFVSTKKMILIK